ncbi:MAG: 50S ribosomal protein L18 [Pirellulaceae bacterium]|nr:50S ribosomal protein L18 [Pirellulaceae bacterium]MDP7015291.1 50S ribosomal protein L18 [Pirellulaceae bacterium]
MKKRKLINKQRLRRRRHSRKKTQGDADQPRLCVTRSHYNMACQLVDDDRGVTLASASTRDKGLRETITYGGNKDAAALVGKAIAEKALAAGIKSVRFDRGHARYHGRVAALADAAREAGLSF